MGSRVLDVLRLALTTASLTPCVMAQTGGTVQWQNTGNISMTAVLSDDTDETWVGLGTSGIDKRLELYQTTGSGLPLWTASYGSQSVLNMTVVSAEQTSFALLGLRRQSDVVVRAYTGASATPVWSCFFDPSMDQFNGGIAIDGDGSTVLAAAAGTGPGSWLYSLDPATGAKLASRMLNSFGTALGPISLSANGDRAAVSFPREVIETAGLTTLFTLPGIGGGTSPVLSRDGNTVVIGGFSQLLVYRDVGSGFAPVFSQTDPQHGYGNGYALSADGSTLFAASVDFLTMTRIIVRVIDVDVGVELARKTIVSAQGLDDSIVETAASHDGEVFALATWGTGASGHPELLVFDRKLNEVAGYDTSGSAIELDMSADGRWILFSWKSVHATVAGSVGTVTVFEVDMPTVYCTAKPSSAGCVTAIGTSSPLQPLSAVNDYSVLASAVQGQKLGLFLFGLQGAAAIPFGGGTLCAQPPVGRTPAQFSGGTSPSSCDGSYALVVNDGSSPTDPGPGNSVWLQTWYRDPQNGVGPLGTALSDAVQLSY